MKTWLYQDAHQVKKLGPEKASWYVGWIDPDGKRRCRSCGSGSRGKNRAEKFARKVEGQLAAGTYEAQNKMTWKDFRKEYESKKMVVMDTRHREETKRALDTFQELVRPVRMCAITSRTIAEFVAKRRVQRGIRPDSLISPATVNKELRHLRAVLRKAFKWGFLAKPVDFDFLREPKRLPCFVPPEEFVRLYHACRHASLPENLPFAATEWWRGLLVTAYMTGWRIGALLALRREDVDLESGSALTRAEDNKGRRDQRILLHGLVLEHLRGLPGFTPEFFPWSHPRRKIWEELARIQALDKIKPTGKAHYTFHDLRRGFATMNAERMTADALQALMQHQDYKTTQRYINLARQLRPAVQNLFVPDLPRTGLKETGA